MANMSPTKNPIPEQDPNVRNKNFEEVALGYTVEMAVDEANRCLNCPRPACMSGCPVNVKIPQFIACVREQDFKGAYHKILEDSSLPAICGRVCPQETQCESKCVRGVKGAAFQQALDAKGICVSVKSACSVENTPSRAVFAVSHDRKTAMSSWRISLSHLTTEDEIKSFLQAFDVCYRELTAVH